MLASEPHLPQRPPFGRRPGRVGAALAGFLVLAGAPGAFPAPAPAVRPEYDVRADLLVQFAKYAIWPQDAAGEAGDLVLGVVGEDPSGGALRALEGRRVLGRKLVVRRFRSVASVRACHILYFPADEEHQLAEARQRLAALGVLTIGETPAFLAAGGAICLFLKGVNLRFAVNPAALEQARVRMEMSVLLLADPAPKGR